MTDWKYNPNEAHWWAAEGTGEITRHWFRPICNRNGDDRRKIAVADRGVAAGKALCGMCDAITRHPSARRLVVQNA